MKFSIDATFSLSFGRFINDSAEKFSNCRPKCCLVEGKYRLMFFSKCFIPLNTELRYDYGDKINQKWRDSRDYLKPLTVNDLRNSLLGKPLKQHLTKVSEVLLCSSSNQLEDVGLKESSLATNLMNQLRQPPAVLFKESEEVLSCKLELEYEPMVSLSDILLVRPTEEKIDESEKKNLMIDIKEIKTMKQKKANSDNVIQESFKISVEECLPTIGIEKTTFMVSNENNGNHHIGLEESPHGSKNQMHPNENTMKREETTKVLSCKKELKYDANISLPDTLLERASKDRIDEFLLNEGIERINYTVSTEQNRNLPIDLEKRSHDSKIVEILGEDYRLEFNNFMNHFYQGNSNSMCMKETTKTCEAYLNNEQKIYSPGTLCEISSEDELYETGKIVVMTNKVEKLESKKKETPLENLFKHKTYRCPVDGCFKEVVNLSRHLQSKRLNHFWSKESAQKALTYFNHRKRSSDIQILFQCPYQNCMAAVKRMDNHLKRVHNFKSSDPFYKKLLNSASKININNMPPNVISSPKQLFKKNSLTESKSASTCSSNDISMPLLHHADSNINFGHIISDINSLPNENKSIVLEKKSLLTDIISSSEVSLNLSSTPYIANIPSTIASESDLSTSGSDDDSDELYIPEDNFILQLDANIEILLNNFKNFLIGPDNKRVSESACRTVRDVQRYFQLVSTAHFNNASNLFTIETIRDIYIPKLESKLLKPGSIKKYLFSLLDFSNFLLSEKESLKISQCSKADLYDIKLKLNTWIKTYNRENKKQHFHRQERDYQSIITPSQISSYFESNIAKEALKLFNYFILNKRPVTLTEYTIMRDHLILVILLGTAHRSGVCANITVDEFLMSEKNADGMFLIPVANHKTFSTYGHMYVVLQPEKFQWLDVFVNKVRSQLSTTYRNIFLSWSGHRMKSGAISERLGSLWKNAGIYHKSSGKRNVCATLLRKSVATGIREQNIGNKDEIAGSMGHSSLTAETNYTCRKNRNTAVKSSKSISAYFQHDFMDSKNSNSNTLDKKIEIEGSMTPTNRKKWSLQEENILKNTFHATPTMSEIMDVLPSIGINATPKKMYDKLRSMFEPAVKTNVTPKRQKMFTKEHILVLHSNGGELISGGPLTQERIVNVLQNSLLLEKYSWQQLRTRILYERKKRLIKLETNDGNCQ